MQGGAGAKRSQSAYVGFLVRGTGGWEGLGRVLKEKKKTNVGGVGGWENGKMLQEIGQEEIGMDGLAEKGGWSDCTGSIFAGGEW